MQTVQLQPLFHNNRHQLAIKFPFNEKLKTHIKRLGNVKWTQTHRCFYIPRSLNNIQKIINHIRDFNCKVDYHAIAYFKVDEDLSPKEVSTTKTKLKEYIQFLEGKRYAESTISTYTNFTEQFIKYIIINKVKKIDTDVIRKFIEVLIKKKAYSISTHRQLVSALKHFCVCFKLEEIDIEQLERPKKSYYLPTVLSKQEIVDLIRSTKNLKHRAVLTMMYSGGLRIGELLKLRLADIDIDRRQLIIKNGKGRKDRYVVLAANAIPLLMNYVTTYRPKYYFVEGSQGKPYTSSSIRQFLKRSCTAAKITKKVTPHTLRHSYATHLLENGIDVRYIQELLGHAKPETTMIYTHVVKKDLLSIESPLDELVQAFSKTDKKNNQLLLSGNL